MDDTGVKRTLRHFAESTSVKGIPRVLKSDRRFLSVLWFVALIFGAAVGFTNLALLIKQYFRYETSTKLSMCNDCRPPFPDVTLCNLNPFNSMPNTTWTFAEYVKHMEKEMKPNLDFSKIQEDLGITDEQLYQMSLEAFSMAGYFQNVNLSILTSYDTWSKHSKFIAQCKWYGWNGKVYIDEDCTTQSVQSFFHSEYFLCHTIHINVDNSLSNNRDVSALHVLLYLNDFTNQPMPFHGLDIHHSQAKGARLVIHPSYTQPELYKGVNIEPGNEVQVHLSTRQIIRQPEPYSQCTDKQYLEKMVQDRGRSEPIRYEYSDTGCTSVCHQIHNLDLCGCVHPRLLFTKELKLSYPEAQFCGKFTQNTTEDLRRYSCYLLDDAPLNQSCDCPLRCDEFVYDYNTFASAWPHESYQYMFYKNFISLQPYGVHFGAYSPLHDLNLENESQQIFQTLQSSNLIEKNFISLKVLFQDRGHEIYEEKPTMTKENFWGMTGGLLNLWVGITFFTMIEVIDLLYKLVEIAFSRRKREDSGDDKGEAGGRELV